MPKGSIHVGGGNSSFLNAQCFNIRGEKPRNLMNTVFMITEAMELPLPRIPINNDSGNDRACSHNTLAGLEKSAVLLFGTS